ncbi:hypothetical protein BGZ90_000176 [Linnemannia elongata]|nr:hypothetical protein BGZ90_000176 [Linnemannia elongata]
MVAFGRNVRHIKDLTAGQEELAFYYNCVLDFEDTHGPFGGGVLTTSQPKWFPPPDPNITQVLALPPMTHLSRVTLKDCSGSDYPISMPSAEDPRAMLGQLCWLVSLNPHLTRLTVNEVIITDPHSGRRLVEVIAGLQGIRELDLAIECRSQEASQLAMDLFYCVKPSIRSFALTFYSGDNSGDEQDQDGHVENSDGLMVMPRRQEPLVNLETLGLWGLWGDQAYVGNILSILGHCPNIVKMLTFDIGNGQGVQTIAEFIARDCPRIRKLARSGSHYGGDAILTFRILEALPAQHITELNMNQWHSVFNQPIASPALLRHLTTLRFLNLQTTNGIARMPAAVIFENCVSLETLRTCEHRIGLYANLDDVKEAPWRCSDLRELLIGFSGCEIPFDHDNPDGQPYYSRPAPIVLSEAEAQHFARLERIYRQVGRLTLLRYLKLLMVKLDGEGQIGWSLVNVPMAFPALMTLGNARQGRPGYLNHLAGLKKLERIAGSIKMDSEETKVTSEWREAVWMYEHWPCLETAQIFKSEHGITAPLELFKDKHMQDGKLFSFF